MQGRGGGTQRKGGPTGSPPLHIGNNSLSVLYLNFFWGGCLKNLVADVITPKIGGGEVFWGGDVILGGVLGFFFVIIFPQSANFFVQI